MKAEDLNLYALKYFFDLVETGSFTRAAEKNFITRSAISQAINRLEKWAGLKLTTHQKKNFELTSAGQDFYRKMRPAFLTLQKSISAPTQGVRSLRVGCSASLMDSYLVPALKKVGSIDSLHLMTGPARQLEYLLDTEEIHLSLMVPEDHGTIRNSPPLAVGQFVIASRDGRMRSQIFTTESRAEVIALKKHLLNKKGGPPKFLTVGNWIIAAKLAVELDGGCLIPDFMLRPRLKRIPLSGYQQNYRIILESLGPEKLSEVEVKLLRSLRG